MSRKCMNYMRSQVWKLVRTQHIGNLGKGIMWDYVERGDFIDCGGTDMKERARQVESSLCHPAMQLLRASVSPSVKWG